MKTKTYFKVLAPTMVAVGITTIILISLKTASKFAANNLFELLHFMPKNLIMFVGAMNVLTYLPFFLIGFLTLGTDGAIGKADKLRTWSAYRYLRNPMYAGLSFTVMGIGLIFGNTAIAAAGLIWLVICFIVASFEEKSLIKKYGQDYINYKKSTPRFIPEFEILIKDLLSNAKKF
jgi:protein-S-isoprenylcysteine O-methyltransferase Ste14